MRQRLRRLDLMPMRVLRWFSVSPEPRLPSTDLLRQRPRSLMLLRRSKPPGRLRKTEALRQLRRFQLGRARYRLRRLLSLEYERGLRAVALECSNTTVIATLDAIDANRRRRVPTEFMVLSQTDAEWELLERAIRQEGRSLRTGEPMEGQYVAILATTRAEPAVTAAAVSIAALLPSVEAALVAE